MDRTGDQSDEVVTGVGCGAALADDLGWGLGVVFRAYVTAADAAVAELPEDHGATRCWRPPPGRDVGSQLALAQHLGIDRTVMTYLLDDLEAAGLIERHPGSGGPAGPPGGCHRDGAAMLTELDERLGEVEARVLEPLDTEERMRFRAQLRRLATRIDTLDPVHDHCALAELPDAEVPQAPFDRLPFGAGPAMIGCTGRPARSGSPSDAVVIDRLVGGRRSRELVPMEKRLVTRYAMTSAGAADENQRRVEDVFAELAATAPGNVSYLVLRLADDSFIHVSFHDHR